MSHSLCRRIALLCLCALAAGLCAGGAAVARGQEEQREPASPAQPGAEPQGRLAPIAVRDPLYRVEFQLPAAFWQHMDSQTLAAQAAQSGGGCAPPQVPPNLLFAFAHKDASARGHLELAERAFLIRDKAGLEEYLDARVAAISSQAGGAMQEAESSYELSEGMVTHRLAFTAPARAGGGCAMQPAPAGGAAMRYAIVHHFIRPRGADALLFVMFCYAPADVFEQLKPEIDFILHSFRYMGEPDVEFFVRDAPEDKVLTAKDAAKKTGGGFNWLMPVGLMLVIWLMLRRKREKAA